MRKISVLIFFIFFSFSLVAQAQNNSTSQRSVKEIYELQERCSKSSEEWYQQRWASPIIKDDESTIFIHYQNHYNRKLNRCLILQEVIHQPTNKNEASLSFLDIYDVNENNTVFAHSIFTGEIDKSRRKLFPSQHGVMCRVQDKTCRSWSDWEKMIKPLMEE